MIPRNQFFIYSGILIGLWGNLCYQVHEHYKFDDNNVFMNKIKDIDDNHNNTESNIDSQYDILI